MSYVTKSHCILRVAAPLILTTLLAACGTQEVTATSDGPGATSDEVVYGTDNRMDVYAHPTATLRDRAAQATVALMEPSALDTSNPNAVTFDAPTLQASENLCSSERFLNDPTAAFCSGTLIDDDLVLTAGHCVTSRAECQSTRFVFNYYRTSAQTMHTVTTADIFSCASIVAREQRTVSGRQLDYAILRLDRAATPRFTPAPVRTATGALTANQGVAVIGSGSGIPFKIDAGGTIRDARSSTVDYFVATTDTFGGSSGSGVYDTASYAVVGILVRGDVDYRSKGSCNVVNTCTNTGCRGEDVSYVQTALSGLCAVSTSARLCGATPPNPPPPPPAAGGSFTYSASNTGSATARTTNRSVSLAAGATIEVGTCTVTGAAATGDTYLRLYSGGTRVTGNDDACGGMASYFTYTATTAGSFEIRAGCYANTACSGTVAYTIR
jgi:V8-like Glu-specific endopeptidase